MIYIPCTALLFPANLNILSLFYPQNTEMKNPFLNLSSASF